MTHKLCKKCGIDKSLDDFRAELRNRIGVVAYCHSCERQKNKEYYQKNKKVIIQNQKRYKKRHPQRVLASIKRTNAIRKEKVRNWRIAKVYNVTAEQYDDMYIRQGGRCAICGKHQSELVGSLHIDHCHETKIIRGLLCGSCNRGIGLLHSDVDILTNAIKYLKNIDNGQD